MVWSPAWQSISEVDDVEPSVSKMVGRKASHPLLPSSGGCLEEVSVESDMIELELRGVEERRRSRSVRHLEILGMRSEGRQRGSDSIEADL